MINAHCRFEYAFRVLRAVADRGLCKKIDIARAEHMNNALVSNVLEILCDNGLAKAEKKSYYYEYNITDRGLAIKREFQDFFEKYNWADEIQVR